MKLPNTVAFAALLGCVLLFALLLHSQRDLALANAAVASTRSANADLAEQVNNLQSKALDDAVLKRLQADQRDAIKLRGEVTTLKTSLAAVEKKLANAASATRASPQQPQPLVPEEPTTNPYARVHSRKINATVPLGHALLFGGWPTEPGKQTFAMAVPSVDPSNPGTVTVQSKIFEISDEALSKLDSTMLVRAAGQQATINPDQLASLLPSLESTPGVSVLASPTMVVASGRQGRASVGQKFPTPDGMIDVGSVIDFVPTLAADGTTVDLAVNAKLTQPNPPPALPNQ